MDIKDRIKYFISKISPSFSEDNHKLVLLNITDDFVVEVDFCGNCKGNCSGSKKIKALELERYLKNKVPEIKQVKTLDKV